MRTKVLIVDDDPLMHLLYKSHLERAGYEVIAAKDGSAALTVAAGELPGLIIMDVMMAGMDGLSALRELKKAELTKKIPVIVITANVTTHTTMRHEAQNAGAAGFLTKPFSPSQLLAEVQRLAPLS